MNFSVHSLGSGSSGNSMLVQAGGTKILLDAGLTMRQLQRRLSKFRVSLAELDAVFLTHEHGDHAKSAWLISRIYNVPVIANSATLLKIAAGPIPLNWSVMQTGASLAFKDILVESFPVSHDAVEPVGYNVYYKCWKISLVTDTGTAGKDILAKIEGANLAIIESNHDVEKLVNGPYPWFLKSRILSSRGHLSNEAAAMLILNHASSGRPTRYWLAHLSETNNSPRLARRYVQRRLSEADLTNAVLEVALRDTVSLTWRPGKHSYQRKLF
ncbi:MAG: MBL fold metallo-hydrolase [Armatimonadota bacterium]|nr:MBL fold metallo-hydrolase [Armatimonadota bacterium]